MAICALGYLGVRSSKLEDWSDLATGLLGMQQVDRAGKVRAFRMDDRKQRFVISDEPGETLAFVGWEVETASDLEMYAARLDAANVPVNWGSTALADRRFVEKLITFYDPHGNLIELFHNPLVTSDPFIPGRPISGFKTGPLGMGHAVLHVEDAHELMPFYRDVLGFKVSDYGMTPFPLYFFHVNDRHHSFAMIGSGQRGFHHFMVEYHNMDDVGQGYDIALLDEESIAFTLGRHTNDWMFSFYTHTPSGFFIESGWGGRLIEQEKWESHETFVGPSYWGHERPYLPDDLRNLQRKMRMDAAAEGKRAPLLIDCPWLYGEFSRPKN